MKLATCIPNHTNLPIDYVKSLINVTKDYTILFQSGPNVASNRNRIMENVRLLDEDLLLIDSDAVFTPEDVEKIKGHLKDKDVITGVQVMSYEPYPPSIFKKENGIFKLYKPEKVEEIEKICIESLYLIKQNYQ